MKATLRVQPEVLPDNIEELYVFRTINVLRGQCVDSLFAGAGQGSTGVV